MEKAKMKRTIIQRFMHKTSQDKDAGCWVWTGARNKQGYGLFCFNGTTTLAHRASFEIHHGTPTQDILHKCDNTSCVNPQHLFSGSHEDNMRDMALKNRACNGNKKITHCCRGHEFTTENTRRYADKYGKHRKCRTCEKIREANRPKRKR